MKHHSPVFQVRPLEERVDADVEDAGAEVLDGHLHLQQPHLPGRWLHALATTHARTSCIRSGESNFLDAVKMQTVVSCVCNSFLLFWDAAKYGKRIILVYLLRFLFKSFIVEVYLLL